MFRKLVVIAAVGLFCIASVGCEPTTNTDDPTGKKPSANSPGEANTDDGNGTKETGAN